MATNEKRESLGEAVSNRKVKLATGGGEPIAKGHKRTNERRVLQPRDEEGRFDYNSSARMSRKEPYHAERNGLHGNAKSGYTFDPEKDKLVPSFARGMAPNWASLSGVKKGERIVVHGNTYISSINLTKEQFTDMIENYFEDDNNEGHLVGDVAFKEKAKGAFDSKEEKKAKEEEKKSGNVGMRKAGMSDENRWGNKTKAEIQNLANQYLAKEFGNLHPAWAEYDGGLLPEQIRKNEAYNKRQEYNVQRAYNKAKENKNIQGFDKGINENKAKNYENKAGDELKFHNIADIANIANGGNEDDFLNELRGFLDD